MSKGDVVDKKPHMTCPLWLPSVPERPRFVAIETGAKAMLFSSLAWLWGSDKTNPMVKLRQWAANERILAAATLREQRTPHVINAVLYLLGSYVTACAFFIISLAAVALFISICAVNKALFVTSNDIEALSRAATGVRKKRE